jgi:YVTN family beta-propeller protein
MRRALVPVILAIALAVGSCAQSGTIWPQLGDQLATPSAMAFNVAANRLYIVNSNSKVLYDWEQGTFQAYDVTDPLSPVLIKSTPTDSFSGEVYIDVARQKAFTPNRYSPDEGSTVDRIYDFNINEAAVDFLEFTEGTAGRDAYAINCCYPADRAWVTTSLNELQYFDLNDVSQPAGSINLNVALDLGGNLSHAEVSHVAIRDIQAFLERDYGGVLVVNLDDAGVAGAVGVDYYINDIPNPRGIAIRGDTLYVVGEGNECGGDYCRFLMVLDVAPLIPIADNATAFVVDKDDAGLLLATIEVGQLPQEVLLSQDFAFVTNQQDDTVSVIDLATNIVVATIDVGDEPFSLALYTTLAGVDQYLYVGNVEDNTISIIDIPTLTVVTTYNGPQ